MEVTRENIPCQVTSDKYEVFHLYLHDEFSDLNLLAQNEDKSEQLLIPVHKKVLVTNLDYFNNMFKETSNFIESNLIDLRESSLKEQERTTFSDKSKSLVPIAKIQVESPRQFAEYLSTFYGHKLKLTAENFLEFYKMADFFIDGKMIGQISKFIDVNNKLTSDNIVEMSKHTENFDKVIIYHIEKKLLDVQQAYRLSQISNRFKEHLDKYFENPIGIAASPLEKPIKNIDSPKEKKKELVHNVKCVKKQELITAMGDKQYKRFMDKQAKQLAIEKKYDCIYKSLKDNESKRVPFTTEITVKLANGFKQERKIKQESQFVKLVRSVEYGFGFSYVDLKKVKQDPMPTSFTLSDSCPSTSFIVSIVKNGPAYLAGLTKGAYLKRINNINVSNMTHDNVGKLIHSNSTIMLHVVYIKDISGQEAPTATLFSVLRAKLKRQ